MKTQSNTTKIIFSILLMIVLSSCQQSIKKHHTLYDELGGMSVVKAITVNLVDRLFKNKDIVFLFEDSDKQGLVDHISNQICLELGGNCQYKGRSMQ